MLAYLLRRFAASLAVLALVSLGTFMMVHLVPGDPVRAMLGEGGQTTAEDIEQMRRQLGLDRPLPVQYLDYVTRAVRGDFGQSIRTDRPVITERAYSVPLYALVSWYVQSKDLVFKPYPDELVRFYEMAWK